MNSTKALSLALAASLVAGCFNQGPRAAEVNAVSWQAAPTIANEAGCAQLAGRWSIGHNDGAGPAEVVLSADGHFEFDGWGMHSRGRWGCPPQAADGRYLELAFTSDQAIWRDALLPLSEPGGYSTDDAYLTSHSSKAPAAAFLVERSDHGPVIGFLGYYLYQDSSKGKVAKLTGG